MEFHVEDHVAALRDSEIYPAPATAADTVEIIQTHISVVALVGERVYKFKKAVRLPFLDFSTAARREGACRDELRLNRRLAPAMYLDVLPLRRRGECLTVGGGEDDGEIVDWCVAMRRLPAERMLDRLLDDDQVRPDEMDRLARHVANFHRAARDAVTEAVLEAGAPAGLVAAMRANFEDLRGCAGDDDGCVSLRLLDAVERRAVDALPELQIALDERARHGSVVEGHGDLHARNVCMTDPPAVYDCIEFRLDFRAGDVATDLAFLIMDLRYRGRPELARVAVDAYVDAAGDPELRAVLPELVRYRAMVRAKVDAIGQAAEEIPDDQRARLRDGARRHLRLAAWTRIEDDGPLLLFASGLPATGKSTAFAAVAAEAGWPVVRTDVVRKELFGVDAHDRLPDEAYAEGASRRVYAEVLRRACEAGPVAMVDANFRSAELRRSAAGVARAARRRVAVVRFDCDETTVRERLRARSGSPTVSDADEAVFDRLRVEYEPPSAAEGLPVVAVDGTAPIGTILDAIAADLVAPSEP